ncbi:MAG: hypothetical protein DRP52_02180 [Planctomycetota bacterium]|nr:MAG: hypothetical protein DRP52_02180 [Planctomycetota bacterium]
MAFFCRRTYLKQRVVFLLFEPQTQTHQDEYKRIITPDLTQGYPLITPYAVRCADSKLVIGLLTPALTDEATTFRPLRGLFYRKWIPRAVIFLAAYTRQPTWPFWP